jgi:carbonyl reductase 1
MTTRIRTALVTGANRGIGLETCRQLARDGLRVLLTSRGEGAGSAGEREARSLASEGLLVEHRQLDVTDPAMVATLADRLRREGLALDVVVNNAGVASSGADPARATEAIEVNFFGALRVTDALLGLVPDGGNVVMVSSGLGQLWGVGASLREELRSPGLTREQVVTWMRAYADGATRARLIDGGWPKSAYAASKVGMNALVRVLARDLAPRRVRVNAASPGWVRTDMGGASAPRSVQQGAASVVRLALPEEGPTGGFFEDGAPVAW